MRDVAPEVDAGPDGVAECPAALGKDVVEWVVINEVHLRSNGQAAGERHLTASSEAIKPGPVQLVSGRCQLGNDDSLERVGWVGDGTLTEG